MAVRKPLVIVDGQVRQNQGQDELDIPLAVRFDALQVKFRTLLAWLLETFPNDLPPSLIEEAMEGEVQ